MPLVPISAPVVTDGPTPGLSATRKLSSNHAANSDESRYATFAGKFGCRVYRDIRSSSGERAAISKLVKNKSDHVAHEHGHGDFRCVTDWIHYIDERIYRDQQTEQ